MIIFNAFLRYENPIYHRKEIKQKKPHVPHEPEAMQQECLVNAKVDQISLFAL